MFGSPRRSDRGLLLAALLCAAAVIGCRETPTSPGGTSKILAITPSIVEPGVAPQVIRFSGANLPASYSLLMIAPGGLTTEVPTSQLQILGSDTFQATVALPTPGIYAFAIKSATGELSSAFELTVGNVTGFPTISGISPPSVQARAQAQSFFAVGTHFEQGLSVVLAAPDGSVVFVSPADIGLVTDTTFQVNLTLTKNGAHLLSVVNPSGGSSNLIQISVTK